ncbi:MAG: hypothetical protein JO036_03810 [Candidatus Eremiobacteraeota bacterium]|nr:hypothetical protein [Candidatus Eremiobacteraeota bacterium]
MLAGRRSIRGDPGPLRLGERRRPGRISERARREGEPPPAAWRKHEAQRAIAPRGGPGDGLDVFGAPRDGEDADPAHGPRSDPPERHRTTEGDAAAARIEGGRAIRGIAAGTVVQRRAALGDRRVGDEPLRGRVSAGGEPQIGDEPVRAPEREDALQPRSVRHDVRRVVRKIRARGTRAPCARECADGIRAVEHPGRVRVRVFRDAVGRRRRRLDQYVVAQRARRVERVLRASIDVVVREPRTERDDARAAVRNSDHAHAPVLEDNRRHPVTEHVGDSGRRAGTPLLLLENFVRGGNRIRREAYVVDRKRLAGIVDDADANELRRLSAERRDLRAAQRDMPRDAAKVRDDLATRRGTRARRPRDMCGTELLRLRIPGDEHGDAVLVASVERARRGELVAGAIPGIGRMQIELRDDDARVARRQHERPQTAKRRPERARVGGERSCAPVLDDREASARSRQDGGVRRARDVTRVVHRGDRADVQPSRAAHEHARRCGRRDEVTERAQPRIAYGKRIDDVAAYTARAASGELCFQGGCRRERLRAAVVRQRDRRNAACFFERRAVECERAEETARRVQPVDAVV